MNEGSSPIDLAAQVYDANINDIKQQKDDESGGTSETEEHNNIVDINNMVAVATERGQHAIARMLENVYMYDCNYSITTEEELREIEENLPDFLHANGLLARATTCEGTPKKLELSSSGFINTTSILQKAEHSRLNNTDEDNDEYIKDDPSSNNAP